MTLTLQFIETNFNVFNKKYFGNKLIKPTFKITNTKNTLGQCSWTNSWKGCERIKINYVIKISKYYDRTEKDYCNTLIHEMIHLYIRQNNIKDTRPHHGQVFYSWANKINKDGWNISRTNDCSECDITNTNYKTYNMVMFRINDGRYFIMKYNKTCISKIANKIVRYNYTGVVWFTSNDSKKYDSMPTCRSMIRGRYITEQEYKDLELLYQYKNAV